MTGQASGRSIGQVLHLLRPDFPDISISKIRFLEAEGLLRPARAPSGYRSYSPADVERLRYILTAQRERFWPLRVIREALDRMDRGLPAEPGAPGEALAHPGGSPDPSLPGPESLLRRTGLRLRPEELGEAAGLDPDTLNALQAYGLLRPHADGHHGEDDLVVARSAAALAAYGLEPRHLRSFRLAADREIGLVEAAAPRGRTPEEREQARARLLAECIALHVALVRAGLKGT